MDPLVGEVIISSELHLQNGAAIYYPISGIREAYIRLDKLGQQRYPWNSTSQLQDMHYQLNTGKTVTWYTSDEKQGVTAITYPISHEFKGIKDVVTCANTILYLGYPRVCRFFDPEEDLNIQGHLGPIAGG